MSAGAAAPRVRDIGLYVHLPFCATRCSYCTFVTSTELGALPQTLAAAGREIERLGGRARPRLAILYLGDRVRCTPRGWLVSNELMGALW